MELTTRESALIAFALYNLKINTPYLEEVTTTEIGDLAQKIIKG